MRKRKTYGTLMIDLQTGQVIDMIHSRKMEDVTDWLKNYSEAEVVSRDGSYVYKRAIGDSIAGAIQVTDRFHLIKGLVEYATKEINSLLPTKVEISIKETFNKAVISDKKPKKTEQKQSIKYQQRLNLIKKIKKRYKEYPNIRGIAREFKMSKTTITKYIKGDKIDFSDNRDKPLDKYKEIIEKMIKQNKKITEIHDELVSLGVKTKYSNTRSYVVHIKKNQTKTRKETINKIEIIEHKVNVYRKDILKLLFDKGISING